MTFESGQRKNETFLRSCHIDQIVINFKGFGCGERQKHSDPARVWYAKLFVLINTMLSRLCVLEADKEPRESGGYK